MTGQEFLDITENIEIIDFDSGTITDHTEVHYKGNVSAGIHQVFTKGGAIIFSGRLKNDSGSWENWDTSYSTIEEMRAPCKEHPNYPIYFEISDGVFSIESVEKVHYDYSGDGDGNYESLDITCSEEPVASSLDRLEKIDVDSYEDMFESVHTNAQNSRMFDKFERP